MDNDQRSGGIGFVGALQIAFIVLKLCGVVDWPWWLVLMPALAWASLLAIVVALAVTEYL